MMRARKLKECAERNLACLAKLGFRRIGIILLFLWLAIWAILLSHYELVIGTSALGLLITSSCITLGPELAGIVIGVIFIDYFNERRQEEQFKKELIIQMGSNHSDVTDTAVRTLRAYGWLEDGTLKRANLGDANLQDVQLTGANLKEADLMAANLEGAWLERANLEGTLLLGANLKGALLLQANLQEAWLSGAYLKGAHLMMANLKGAEELTFSQLRQASVVEGATMPDGTVLRGIINPDGPTLEEWIVGQEVDERVVAEVDSLLVEDEEE